MNVSYGAPSPTVEVIDHGAEIVVTMELPLAVHEKIKVYVLPSRVVVFVDGKERMVLLPSECVPDQAGARFHNGVLEVVLPKRMVKATVSG